MTAPLSGVKVLEVANMIAAPSAAALMADLGADVTKVEPPTGDILRDKVLPGVEPDPWFHLENRGKRGVVIDLTHDAGRAAVLALAAQSDVFVTNLTAERQRRFGVTSDDIHAVAPRAVHASLSGYGARGADADRLAYDMTAFFARGGIQHLVAEPGGPPAAFRAGQGDHTSALSLLAAILAALRLRDLTGEPQVVEVALYQVAAWTIASDLSAAMVSNGVPERHVRANWPSPLTCRFRTSDGRWVALCMPGPKDFFPAFADCLGHPEWVDDERFATPEARRDNAAAIIAAVDAEFATRDRDDWAERLDHAGLTWAPVQDTADISADPQAFELGIFQTIEDHGSGPFHTIGAPFGIPNGDVGVRGRAPDLGEHTREVFEQAGLAPSEVDDLFERGIIR